MSKQTCKLKGCNKQITGIRSDFCCYHHTWKYNACLAEYGMIPPFEWRICESCKQEYPIFVKGSSNKTCTKKCRKIHQNNYQKNNHAKKKKKKLNHNKTDWPMNLNISDKDYETAERLTQAHIDWLWEKIERGTNKPI